MFILYLFIHSIIHIHSFIQISGSIHFTAFMYTQINHFHHHCYHYCKGELSLFVQSPQLLQHNYVHISFAFRQIQWQPCCSTEIFHSLVRGILFLGRKQQSGTNNLVSCQVEGQRIQYLRCGNLWRNIWKNRMDCMILYDIYRPRKCIR